MKKNKIVCTIIVSTCLSLCLCCAGCAPSENTSESQDAKSVEASEDSLITFHENMGQDFSAVSDVSIETCTSTCHDGSWDSVVEKTDALWAGFGQIPDANPHYAHATNAFECSDCHSLTDTSVNQCNGCHNFETPSTWIDKDPTTTIYGITADEPTV